MYCSKCGNLIEDNSSFCSKCGYNVQENVIQENSVSNNNYEDNNDCIFGLKSTFVLGYEIYDNIPFFLIFSVIMSLLMFTLKLMRIDSVMPYENRFEGLLGEIIIGIVVVAIIFAIKFIFDKLQHDNIEYNFYKDRVEYKDGFLDCSEKEIKYINIREIRMHQGIIERMFNIGTIAIYTSSGLIFFHCIKNVDENYKKVKQIINM